MTRFNNAMLAFCVVLVFCGCEKEEVFLPDESIHNGSVIASTGEELSFYPSFTTFPNHQSGLYHIVFQTYPTDMFNKPPLFITIRTDSIRVGCVNLTHAPAIPIGGAITYPNAIALILSEDQVLGRYMLREDRESEVCITEVLRDDGREITGTFDLHMFRPSAGFPWLETNWPDTLSLTNGTFRAYGRILQ